MKQSIILWTAAAVITFIAGFLQSRLSGDYPVSGSFGIEGKEIGYKLDKVSYGDKDYPFFLKSEIKNLKGTVNWRQAGTEVWEKSELSDSSEVISGKIPAQKPLTKVEYYAAVHYNGKSYKIPHNNKPVTLTFYGNIPASISFYYWFTLLGLVMLSVRTGLEYFHHPGKIKKLNIFTLIFAVVNVFAFHPLRTTYKLGAVGKTIIPITEMFQLSSILLVATWIVATALIFNIKNNRIWAPAAAVATLLIFELGKY